MERGILFSNSNREFREYERNHVFAAVQKSSYWDKLDERMEVTPKEALKYDAIMERLIAVQFY